LNETLEKGKPEELTVDIRRGYPGGEYPVNGTFRLRSFDNILNFLGRSITDEPEHSVPPSPLTPYVAENPINTMEIVESENSPTDDGLSVSYQRHYYSLRPDKGYPWNIDYSSG
jgi:hypothetical protein